jgi:predicted AlkP superfamily pyrophosphatase or phosphodiesterase
MYDSHLNETFYDLGKNENDTRWFGQNPDVVPIWILNQLKDTSRKSGIIGGFPGANVPIRNKTVSYSEDYLNNYDPYEKIDRLVDLFTLSDDERINFGVLYFPEPDETGHEFGPYSQEIRRMLFKCDSIVGFLIERLMEEGLFESMNIIITSDHGMDTASYENSLDLSDYVDITKFKSYGGLTQINILPNDRKKA